jgi:hypothetical protein
MGSQKERLILVEVERKLSEDEDGTYRKGLLDQLNRYAQLIQQRMDEGLDPVAFDVFNKLKIALKSARDSIENFK